ncbi:hypothetical protein BBP40_010165 [Aspergillus hancockii]|nr:hypothetical protein BBP40_010165 [Aspergillus hancockii]
MLGLRALYYRKPCIYSLRGLPSAITSFPPVIALSIICSNIADLLVIRLRSSNKIIVQPATDFVQSAPSFNPFINSFQTINTALGSSRKRKDPPTSSLMPLTKKTTANETLLSLVRHSIDLLHQEYTSRIQASTLFPPEISPSSIRSSIARYEKIITAADREVTCCSCGRLVPLGDVYQVLHEDPLLQPLEGRLDNCGWKDGFWNVCCSCYSALFRRSIPKFSSLNQVNVTLCQHYPSILSDLTLPEEYLIAKSHPVGAVLKLRPGGQSSPLNYHALRGHFIVIPQDPGPLLQILPSPELHLTELIKVCWLGHCPPTDCKV